MKIKKNLKRFFSMNRQNGGFTLVELIVVIAILAILAGIGIPAYSGYITKANKGVDEQLLSEVTHALQLYYYENISEKPTGFVVLTPEGDRDSFASDEFAQEAMNKAFGTGWEEVVRLKYNGWIDNVANALSSENVVDSTFVKLSTSAAMMESITDMTNQMASMAADAGKDPLTTMSNLAILTTEQAAAIRKDIKDNYGLEYDKNGENSKYATVLSNSLLKYVVDDMGSVGQNGKTGADISGLSNIAGAYATIYAWSLTSGEGANVMDEINAVVLNPNSNSKQIRDTILGTMGELASGGNTDFDTYFYSQGQIDAPAVYDIMSVVSKYTNGTDMTARGVFASEEFGNKLNGYMDALRAVGTMDPAVKGKLDSVQVGDLVLFLNSDGSVLTEYDG